MPLPRSLCVKEAAELLDVTPKTVRVMCEEGRLPAVQTCPRAPWRIKVRLLAERRPDLYAEIQEAWVERQTRDGRAKDMAGW